MHAKKFIYSMNSTFGFGGKTANFTPNVIHPPALASARK